MYKEDGDEQFLSENEPTVVKLLKTEGEAIYSTNVLQYKKFDTSRGRNKDNAKAFMAKVAKVGFGAIEQGKTKRSVILRKAKSEDLPQICRQFIIDNVITWE